MERLVYDDVLLAKLDAHELVVLEDLPADAVRLVCQLEGLAHVGLEVEVHLLRHVLDGLPVRRVIHQLEEVPLRYVIATVCALVSIETDVVGEDVLALELECSVNLFRQAQCILTYKPAMSRDINGLSNSGMSHDINGLATVACHMT